MCSTCCPVVITGVPEDPVLRERRINLFEAVRRNRVDTLKNLLDDPKWYSVTDEYGYNLLQIAVMHTNKGVFDYILSLPGFPLNFKNEKGYTAFILSFISVLNPYDRDYTEPEEYFAYELIVKGVDIGDFLSSTTPLHQACRMSYLNVAKLLIEKGVDVNILDGSGHTALFGCHSGEICAFLLFTGIHVSEDDFQRSLQGYTAHSMTEALFPFVYDEFSQPELTLVNVLKLAESHREKTLFYELVKLPVKIIDEDDDDDDFIEIFGSLNRMDIPQLKTVLEKFGDDLINLFSTVDLSETSENFYYISLDHLSVILSSNVGPSFVTFISSLEPWRIFRYLNEWDRPSINLYTHILCFFLSYNLRLTETELITVYSTFKYSELFKILLHMDIEGVQESSNSGYRKTFVPILVYNIYADVETFLDTRDLYWDSAADDLLDYFVHPKLADLYNRPRNNLFVTERRTDLPKMPLLLELARNEFRKYFVRRLQLKTSRDFYTQLARLPISPLHKKIISYEAKLY